MAVVTQLNTPHGSCVVEYMCECAWISPQVAPPTTLLEHECPSYLNPSVPSVKSIENCVQKRFHYFIAIYTASGN